MSQPTLRPKVLIADDETTSADTLAMILNHVGFDARAVYTCQNALELASTFRPDMLISDVLMSDNNGLDAAVQMRSILPDIRVFLLSGQTADVLEQSAARALGFEVLLKPVHPQDLVNKLQRVMPIKNVA